MTLSGKRESGFYIVKLGRRPLLAIPVGSGCASGAAVQCYPAHTWKRRAVRSLIHATFWSGVPGVMWTKRASPVPAIPVDEFESWNEQIRQELSDLRLQSVFVWPANPERGRIYVHWLNSEGKAVAFTKLALNSYSSALIENERSALEQLAKLRLKKCRVPRVLSAGRLRQHSYLVVEAAPQDARVTDWQKDSPIEEHVREFAGPTVRKNGDEVTELPWWGSVTKFLDRGTPLLRSIRNIALEGFDVCRVHGDLNQTNVLRDGEHVWLLDWECSSEAGPCLTDHICIVLDRIWPVTQQNARKGLKVFLRQNWDNKEKSYRDQVLLALGFLAMCAFPPALAILKEWELILEGERNSLLDLALPAFERE